jgi:glycosyltransferase involved in cell wall biosynthesis
MTLNSMAHPLDRKVCWVVSSEMTVRAFLLDTLFALSRLYSVTLVVNTETPDLLSGDLGGRVRVIPLRIERQPSPWRDLLTTYHLLMLFRRERFDLVHSISPKSGLLGMLAAWLTGVPIRLHTFQGEVWFTRTGIWRFILKSMDRLVGWLITDATVVSHSEQAFLIEQQVLAQEKSVVLANGSIAGVDLSRFRPDSEVRASLRAKHGVADNGVVFLYMGRLNRDKGITELAEAFALLARSNANVYLWLVGADEEQMLAAVSDTLAPYRDHIFTESHVSCPEQYMAAADVLVLPSHREGFGVVIIEAAACGIPAVASRVYGLTDAMQEGVTGLMHPVGSAQALCECMTTLSEDAALRQRMGEAARARTCADFSRQAVQAAFLAYYAILLGGPT